MEVTSMAIKALSRGLTVLGFTLAGSTLLWGCGDDAGTGAAGAGGHAVGGGNAGGGGATGGAAAGGGGAGGSGAPSATVVATLDASAYELPEGLAIDGSNALVGFAFTGAIEHIALDGGAREPYAALPPPPANTAFVTGLTKGPDAAVYAAYVSFTADAPAGIYRVASAGATPELFATHPQLVFPNGFAWGPNGVLYVTDSASGAVFQIGADGQTELFYSDALLAGSLDACGPHGDTAVGANGLVLRDGALFVASSDQALVVRVPIEADGTAGTAALVAGPDCAALAGIDGLTLDADGSLVAAINRQNRIVRIDPDTGATTNLFEGGPLDFPASLEFAGVGSERALYVTSFALGAFLSGGDPHPAIVRIDGL
ncbi:MAG: SMP-30/gluconolactonase/LRE family protein [Polyangiaceae bacterium]